MFSRYSAGPMCASMHTLGTLPSRCVFCLELHGWEVWMSAGGKGVMNLRASRRSNRILSKLLAKHRRKYPPCYRPRGSSAGKKCIKSTGS